MGSLSIWVAMGLLVLFVVYLGFRRSKTNYLIFLLVIGLVVLFASKFLQFLNGSAVGRKYTEVTGTPLNVDPLGPFSSILDKMSYSSDNFEIALVIFLTAVFVLTRIAKFISNIFKAMKPEESQKKLRKRVLKNFGLKSMKDVRKFY